MKTTITKLSIFSLLLLVLVSCIKDTEMTNGEFVNLKTNEATEITAISAVVNAVAKANCTERGVCWGKSSNPTIDDFHVANGSGKGEYTCTLTDLEPGRKYYYRAYGFDGKRYAYAKDEKEFVTKDGVVKVTTDSVCEITTTSARVKCEVTHDGGSAVTERGVCWSKDHEPTLDDEHLANGSGLGMFICALNGLEPDVTYQVRAYAKNASGLGFGEVLTFTTNAQVQKPTVSTVEVTDVTATSATCTGNVSSDGGAEVTERGACWSTNENPTISSSHLASGSGTGSFTVNMTGLTANKTYYVRTYATNSQGTAYGEQKTFTTTEGLAVVTTGSVTEITATSAKCGGNVTDQGASAVTERGICWSTNHNPTLNGSHVAGGSGVGLFTCQMTGLTPNATYYVRAYAKNSQGVSYGSEVSFTALEGLPVVTTNDVTDITTNTAKCGGNVTDQGGSNVTERGVCWSTSHNPTTTGAHANSGTGGGSYTCTMTGLAQGITYYVRAYAKNTQGISYGEEKQFTTLVNKPTVTTNSVTSITQNSATGGGNVTNDGGATVTERGICWSTSQNPTISSSHVANGTGTGSFNCQMTGLTAGTRYYVRAYATNSAGTSYGSQVDFTTTANLPTVTTAQVSNITQTTALGGGNVTNDGGASVTERGICWSTSHNPTASDSHATSGTGTGSFTANMTGLTANTTYYVRAYAKNSQGTAYGSEVSFTTINSLQAPTGAINGLFTINDNGDQVWFSKGNLQYQASTNTWKFADHQWDYVGESNANISSSYSGWIDLFGWGTSGYDHGAICYLPWSTSENGDDYYAYGDGNYSLFYQTGEADWGYNAISNGGNTENQWRTLSGGGWTVCEWYFLFKVRSTASGIRYAKARVNNVNGIILVPDNWSASTYTLSSTNAENADFSSNVISSTVWNNTLEPAGCVFFPAGGKRCGILIYDVGSTGIYWSSSSGSYNYTAYCISFDNAYFNTGDGYGLGRWVGSSVRLVQDYNP